MDDFFLLVGGLIFFSWVLAYILKSIIKAPSKIAYHLTGQAEIDKQAAANAKVKRAEEKIEFEKQERERKSRQIKEFALEVEAFKTSLKDKEIFENELVVFRRGDSTIVEIARFKELQDYSSFDSPNPMHYTDSDLLRPGWIYKKMRYAVYGPIVIVNVAENKSFIRKDYVRPFDIPEYSIAKASPEFESIYDDKVYKPLRDKAEAKQAEKLRLINAKSKLDSMFK